MCLTAPGSRLRLAMTIRRMDIHLLLLSQNPYKFQVNFNTRTTTFKIFREINNSSDAVSRDDLNRLLSLVANKKNILKFY